MQVISVIPITRSVTKEELSYYSPDSVTEGDIVTVPLRQKKIPALVTDRSSVQDEKAALRGASYALKKIVAVHTRAPLRKEFMQTVRNAAHYFACTDGAMLSSTVPRAVLEKPMEHNQKERKNTPDGHIVEALQDDESTRTAFYKSLAREHFAKKESLLVLSPTRASAEQLYTHLKKGISDNTLLLHTGFTKKKQCLLWQEALAIEHPVLIVATPQYLSLPRTDITTIIVDQESSRHYTAQRRPYVDFRTVARLFSEAANIQLLYGDILLRLETLQGLRENRIVPVTAPRMHYMKESPPTLVDMTEKNEQLKKAFHVLSPELHTMLMSLTGENDRCYIYTMRKGLYPLTICGDCGQLVTCRHCSAPVVVHTSKGLRPHTFVCHRCHTKRTAEEKCINCTSWNLVPLGIGSERVRVEIEKALPDMPTFLIDTDAMTPSQIQKTIATWQKTPRSVLIGTETIFPYLNTTSHIAVASMDTLLALPDFRASERMLRISLFLASKASSQFLIQTRNPERSIFTHITSGTIAEWITNELQERKQHNYPPYRTLIKITTRGSASTLPRYIEEIETKLKKFAPVSFPAFTEEVKGKHVMHTLLSIEKGTWPDKVAVHALKELPQRHEIRVDPEHLL